MKLFGIYPPKRHPNNTYKALIKTLNENPFLSENELMIEAFGYDRNTSSYSNKKYADMLRRAMRRGEIRRVKAKVEGCKAKYFYYLNGERRHLKDVRKIVNSSIIKKDKVMKYNLDLIRSEVPVARKASNINEVPSIHLDSLNDDVKDLIGMCKPVRADFFADDKKAPPIDIFDYFLTEQHNILIVNTPDEEPFVRFFYVDTQGYSYARYCGEIIDVDNQLEDYFNEFVDTPSTKNKVTPEVDTKHIAEIVTRFCNPFDESLNLEMRVNGDYLDFYPQDVHTLLDLLLKGEDIRIKPRKETIEIRLGEYMITDPYFTGKKLVMDFVDSKPQYDTVRFEDVSN
jgi:hypothetical protein